MSVTFLSSGPADLLKLFDDAVDQPNGRADLACWEKLSDGIHYTHRASAWRGHAFFRAKVSAEALSFHIIRPRGGAITSEAYAYYHSRLIEAFLNNFDLDFKDVVASAVAGALDLTS